MIPTRCGDIVMILSSVLILGLLMNNNSNFLNCFFCRVRILVWLTVRLLIYFVVLLVELIADLIMDSGG